MSYNLISFKVRMESETQWKEFLNKNNGLIMKWEEIRQQYPEKFVLLGDVVEEKVSDNQSKILEANVLEASGDGKEILMAYRKYKRMGMDVLYSLPTTPTEFIIETS